MKVCKELWKPMAGGPDLVGIRVSSYVWTCRPELQTLGSGTLCRWHPWLFLIQRQIPMNCPISSSSPPRLIIVLCPVRLCRKGFSLFKERQPPLLISMRRLRTWLTGLLIAWPNFAASAILLNVSRLRFPSQVVFRSSLLLHFYYISMAFPPTENLCGFSRSKVFIL